MKKEDAIKEGITGLAYRMKGAGGLMFWGENTGYWTQGVDGKIKKCNAVGPRVQAMEDWQPVFQGSKEHDIYEQGYGFVTPPQWKQMVDISPVKRAVRLTKNDHYMVCLEDGTQYIQSPVTDRLYKASTAFTSYRDWAPVTEGNVFATTILKEDQVPFRDPRFPHASIKDDPEEIAIWVATGTSPKIEAWKAKCKREQEEHNAKVTKRHTPIPKGVDVKEHRSIPLQSVKPCKVRDIADPTIIANVGPMTTALASGMASMVEIGEKEAAVKLADALAQLVKNASWMLREDRTAHAAKRAASE